MALHTINYAKLDGFEVSTCLFEYRMETRVFATDSDLIPLEIVEAVAEVPFAVEIKDQAHVTPEPKFLEEEDSYSKTQFTGLSVETYAFIDAQEVHTFVVKMIKKFLDTHTRVVTYVTK